ncbi:unnamed protein product, partial [Discosporangium mesarthrocarpum]
DKIAPTVKCKDIEVALDANGSGSYSEFDINNGSTDNCSIGSGSTGYGFFQVTCTDLGKTFPTTLTMQDPAGNQASCTANVTIVDKTAPTATCQDVTLILDGSGIAATTASAISASSTDNCGLANLSLDVSSFNCANVGKENTVTLTASDLSGNSNTCTAKVTVVDQQAPTAICQDVSVRLDAAGNVTVPASAVNNGSNDACGIGALALDVSSFTRDNLGSNVVVLTVTDKNANTSTCSATITIL